MDRPVNFARVVSLVVEIGEPVYDYTVSHGPETARRLRGGGGGENEKPVLA